MRRFTPSAPRRPAADEALLDGSPSGSSRSAARPDRGRAARRDPALAEPRRGPGGRGGLSDPRRADLPAAPRPTRPLAASSPPTTPSPETARPSSSPELIIRFGDLPTSKPLRQWLAAIEGLDQIVIDPTGEWREPTRRAATLLRADPAATARALDRAALAPAAGRRHGRGLALRRGLARRRARGAGGGRRPHRGARRAQRAGRLERAGTRAARRRLGVRRLEHARARPGGLPAPGARGRSLRRQPGRQRDRRAGLDLRRSRRRQRQPDLGGARRPRPLPRPRRPGGRSATRRSCA